MRRRRPLHRRRRSVGRTAGVLLAGASALALSLTVAVAPVSSAGATTFAPVGTFFVADSGAHQLGSVTPTGVAGTPITLAGVAPSSVALSADGTTAWVTDPAAGTLTRVDTATGAASTITLGAGTDPVAVAVDPFGITISTEVFVAEDGATGHVVGIDPATTSVNLTSGALDHPDALALASDGSALAVALDQSSATSLVVLTPGTLTTASAATGAGGPDATAIVNMPSAGEFYVASAGDHKLSCFVFNVTPCTSSYDVTLGATAPPVVAMARNAGGTRLVVVEQTGGTPNVVVVDLTSTHLGHTTTVTVTGASGVAVSADGTAAVTDASGTVALLSLTSWTHPLVTTTVTGFTSPAGIAAAPEVAPTASFTYTLAAAGSPTTFDAAASTPGTSPIAQYSWTFGDGSAPVTTTSPTVSHTFATPVTSYEVTLTVTGADGATADNVVTGGQSTIVDGGPQAAQTQQLTGFVTPAGVTMAYVTMSATGNLGVIDTQTATSPGIVGFIALEPNPTACPGAPFTSCSPDTTYPSGITSSPTGARMYVDASAGSNPTKGAIDVVDVATNRVAQVIGTNSDPQASAISPNGKTLYVAASNSVGGTSLQVVTVGATPPTVVTVPLPTGQFLPNGPPFGTAPGAVAVGDSGSKVVVAVDGNGLARFDVFTVEPTGTVTPTPVGVSLTVGTTFILANAVAVNPRHTTVAYGIAGSGSSHAVTVMTLLDPATAPGTVGVATGFAGAIAADRNGKTVAVALTPGLALAVGPLVVAPTTPFVAPLSAPTGNPKTLSVVTPPGAVALPPAALPTGMAFLPSGTRLYVVDDGTGSVTVLDTITKVVTTVVFPTPGSDIVDVAFGTEPAAPRVPTPSSTPDFTVSKSDTPGTGKPVVPGATIGYSVKVANVGTSAGTATVTDPLPSNVALAGTATCATVAPGDSCAVHATGTTLTMTVSLAKGDSATMTFDADVAATDTTTVVNTATITTGPCTGAHCTSTVTNPVVVLQVVKSSTPASGSTVPPRTTVTYTLTLTDTGTAATTPITVTDAVPAGTTYVPGSATCAGAPGCSVSEATGTVTWKGIVVAPGTAGALPVSFQATVGATDTNGQRITNVAAFSNDGTPGCTGATCTTNTVTLLVGVAATPSAPTPPVVAHATTPHTGEPFAGSWWLELLVLLAGIGLVGLGESSRRRRRPATVHVRRRTR